MSESNATSGTALAAYNRVQDVPAFITQLGESIARSAMFGCENPHQGKVLAMECMARGLPPLALAEQYNIIKGKLSMKADAMLGNFCRIGGKHRIISRTADVAAVELTYDGDTQSFSLTWDEARQEPFVYQGKEAEIVKKLLANQTVSLKPKYATPRSRTQMLWARVVSDAVRTMTPEVVSGIYTPEEVGDVVGLDAMPSEPIDDDVVDVDGEMVESQPTEPTPQDDGRQIAGPNDVCTEQLALDIDSLAQSLGMTTRQLNAAVQSRGAELLRDLTLSNAEELLAKLRNIQLEKDAAKVF